MQKYPSFENYTKHILTFDDQAIFLMVWQNADRKSTLSKKQQSSAEKKLIPALQKHSPAQSKLLFQSGFWFCTHERKIPLLD